jgi:hypothetical protein
MPNLDFKAIAAHVGAPTEDRFAETNVTELVSGRPIASGPAVRLLSPWNHR